MKKSIKELTGYQQRLLEKKGKLIVNNGGDSWGVCEVGGCLKFLFGAGHHGEFKNRNKPEFWGLEIPEKVICLNCLGEKYYQKLSESKQKIFKIYRKRGYV